MSDPPFRRERMFLRSVLAGVVIVLLTAGATATAGLLELKSYIDPPTREDPSIPEAAEDEITRSEAGKPQTLLLLGSDRRYIDKKNGDKPRSDTMMLVRLDPDEDATTVLSIPRDLKVEIPGRGVSKINDAYMYGGPALTLKTVKALTGLKVHHVISVNFGGFREAVNTLGCFYADVDRRYYNSNVGVPIGQRYDAIDIKPGYQKLCGGKALDYVRFRHDDSDIVRAARQQDFLRATKDQLSTSRIIDDSKKLARVFNRASQTDRSLSTLPGFIRLLKLGLYSAKNPIRQMEFPATFTKGRIGQDQADFVEATPAEIDAVVDDFLNGGGESAKPAKRSSKGKRGRRRHRAPESLEDLVASADVVDARDRGEALVAQAKGRSKLGFPVRFPRYLPAGAYVTSTKNPRMYPLRDRADKEHSAYRFTLVRSAVDGAYYGVQGTTWRTPPALAHPSAKRVIGGRTLELFRSGRRLRFVAWRTRRATYWISNTLTMTLRDDEMLAMAASLTTARKRR